MEVPADESHPLAVYLRVSAAGGAQDAKIFRALVESGGSFESGEADAAEKQARESARLDMAAVLQLFGRAIEDGEAPG